MRNKGNNLPPGCNLNNDPGQHDPPTWAYISADGDIGWRYNELTEPVRIAWWTL